MIIQSGFSILAVVTLLPVSGIFFEAQSQPSAKAACVGMAYGSVRPIVRVMVNGEGPFRFLIDTGGDGEARIDIKLVKKLHLQPLGRVMNNDSTKKNSQAVDVVELKELELGSLSFRNVKAMARDYGQSFDGILAFNLFKDKLLTLDYPHKRVFVSTGYLSRKNSLTMEVPEGTPVILGRLGNERLKIDVDSGDSEFLTVPKDLSNKLTFSEEPKVIGHGRSATHEYDVKEGRIKESLHLGTETISSPKVVVSEIFSNVNIGSPLLSQYQVSFDQKRNLMRLSKSEKPACPVNDDKTSTGRP